MATKLSKALRTDLATLAQLIREQGRGRDTILAHITPQEAALLKSRGGSGTTNPVTGLPEFQEDYVSGYDIPSGADVAGTTVEQAGPPITAAAPEVAQAYTGYQDFTGTPTTAGYEGFTPAEMAAGSQPSPQELAAFQERYPTTPDAYAKARAELGMAPLAQEPGLLDKAGTAISKAADKLTLQDVLRLGGIGAQAALGTSRARTGAAQAEKLRSEMQQQAEPYYQRGREYIAKGESGQLLPAQQQALEAQRAQAAQARAKAGVSETSTMAQQQNAAIQRQADVYRQQLIDYGYQLVGIGDQITQNAIKAGYSASQDAQNAASRFYQSMASLIPGFSPASITTQRSA